jgi:hypothetical protein
MDPEAGGDRLDDPKADPADAIVSLNEVCLRAGRETSPGVGDFDADTIRKPQDAEANLVIRPELAVLDRVAEQLTHDDLYGRERLLIQLVETDQSGPRLAHGRGGGGQLGIDQIAHCSDAVWKSTLGNGMTGPEQRAAENEAAFRALNERIARSEDSQASNGGYITFICECSTPDCTQRVELTPSEYAGVRAEPRHFLTAPGHINPAIEHVVLEADRYTIVRKHGEAALIADQTDA